MKQPWYDKPLDTLGKAVAKNGASYFAVIDDAEAEEPCVTVEMDCDAIHFVSMQAALLDHWIDVLISKKVLKKGEESEFLRMISDTVLDWRNFKESRNKKK